MREAELSSRRVLTARPPGTAASIARLSRRQRAVSRTQAEEEAKRAAAEAVRREAEEMAQRVVAELAAEEEAKRGTLRSNQNSNPRPPPPLLQTPLPVLPRPPPNPCKVSRSQQPPGLLQERKARRGWSGRGT